MVEEYEVVKKFVGECRYYIEAKSEEEAIAKARNMDVMNARVEEVTDIDVENVECMEDEE